MKTKRTRRIPGFGSKNYWGQFRSPKSDKAKCARAAYGLEKKAYELEKKFFTDMTLEDYEKELTAQKRWADGKWETVYGDLWGSEKVSFASDKRRFMVVKGIFEEGVLGRCNVEKGLIKIITSQINDDFILLHKMIHAYEFMLEPHEGYAQFVLIKLYEKLLPQIPNLREVMMWDWHIKNRVHTPLFLLKSLDLDIQLNRPLGTVYSYARAKFFRHFTRKKQKRSVNL